MSTENTAPAAEEVVAEAPAEQPADTKKKKKKEKKKDDYTNPNNRKFKTSAIVILSCAAVLIAFLATFVFVGNTWFVKINIEDNNVEEPTYTEEQITSAAKAIVSYFHSDFPGSILQELDYSEKWSGRTEKISFTGKFYAMFSNNEKIEAPTTVSKKWHWDVELDSASGEYTVVSYGFADDVTVVGEEPTQAESE